MGWLFTQGLTRSQLIKERTSDSDYRPPASSRTLAELNGPKADYVYERRCLRHTCVGNTLWTVWEVTKVYDDLRPAERERYIGCDLIRNGGDIGFGYKDMDEAMGPTERTCPPAYFDLVPMPDREWAQEWRDSCRAFYARRSKAKGFKDGDVVVFEHPIKFRGGDSLNAFLLVKNGRRSAWKDATHGRNGWVTYRLSTRCFEAPYTVMSESEFTQSHRLQKLTRELEELGWDLTDTGGGCTAWHKRADAEGSYWLLTSEAEAPTDLMQTCILGRYSPSGEQIESRTGTMKELVRSLI